MPTEQLPPHPRAGRDERISAGPKRLQHESRCAPSRMLCARWPAPMRQ